jgi:FkbM family methyltransferase
MAHARRQQSLFESICQRCGLSLDYAANRDGFPIFKEVFIERLYADYFPFYQRNTVLDVGGHFGYFAMFAALSSAAGSRIITVEPSAHNVSVLRANIARSGLRQIEIIHGAVASQTGALELHVSKAHNCSLFADHARAMSDGQSLTTERVDAFSLADMLAKTGVEKVDVLKLDCEGAEYSIIYDTPADVLRRARVIMMEFHDMKDAAKSGLAMVEALRGKGFRIGQFRHLPTTMNLNYGKIIAIRE